jgi:hypothetical protein
MSFRSILRSIVEECGGGLGAVLMGADGIPIEEYVTDRIPEGPLQEDIGSAGVEFSAHPRRDPQGRRRAPAAARSARRSWSLARMTSVFRPIDGETFLALVARDAMATSARRAISSAASPGDRRSQLARGSRGDE